MFSLVGLGFDGPLLCRLPVVLLVQVVAFDPSFGFRVNVLLAFRGPCLLVMVRSFPCLFTCFRVLCGIHGRSCGSNFGRFLPASLSRLVVLAFLFVIFVVVCAINRRRTPRLSGRQCLLMYRGGLTPPPPHPFFQAAVITPLTNSPPLTSPSPVTQTPLLLI